MGDGARHGMALHCVVQSRAASWPFKTKVYQSVASVAGEYNNINGCCMISNTNPIRFGPVLFVVKLNDSREAAAEDSKAGFGCPIVNWEFQKAQEARNKAQSKWHDHQITQL